MPKIAFHTLGCKSNQYETEAMKALVSKAGFEIVNWNTSADFHVINTCTVTHVADKKSRQAIRHAIRTNPETKVIVTGCYSELEAEQIKQEIPEIYLVLKNKEKRNILNWLMVRGQHRRQGFLSSPIRVRMNLMIEDGCEHFCSYCIVPYARGKVKSKPLPEIFEEARELVEQGAREIVLTGINLGAYGKCTMDVIQELSKIEGLLRIRLSSLEPMYITRELIDTIAETPKVCPHLHLPLQSGDNSILKAMHRNYSQDEYLKLIDYTRSKMPDAGINTDIIVGFPGEGEAEFQNTIDLVNKIKFSRMHIFTYSPRKGTAAEKLRDTVDLETKAKRSQILHGLREKYMREFAEKYFDREVEVLVECRNKEGKLEGLTENYIRINFDGSDKLIGQLRKLTLDSKNNVGMKPCRGQG